MADGKRVAGGLQGRMRMSLAIVATLVAISSAAAEPPLRPKPDRTPHADKTLPLQGTKSNSCAAYGPGFVKVEGTGSCVKIGGGIGIGVGVSSRR
jgi:hypothetical protein